MSENLRFYTDNANTLITQYDSVSFVNVHNNWLHLLPRSGHALDIGAGSGRDARYLASKGLKVYAVEPASALRLKAIENSVNYNITWLNDTLPSLEEISALGIQFNIILLSAVWMHLSPQERQDSMNIMVNLLSDKGKLIITLRHGSFSDIRTAYTVSAQELSELAQRNGLSVLLSTSIENDKLGRGNVAWQTVVLEK